MEKCIRCNSNYFKRM